MQMPCSKVGANVPQGRSNHTAKFQLKRSWSGLRSSRRTAAQHVGTVSAINTATNGAYGHVSCWNSGIKIRHYAVYCLQRRASGCLAQRHDTTMHITERLERELEVHASSLVQRPAAHAWHVIVTHSQSNLDTNTQLTCWHTS